MTSKIENWVEKIDEWIEPDQNRHPFVTGSRLIVVTLALVLVWFTLIFVIVSFVPLGVAAIVLLLGMIYYAFIHNWLVNRK